MANFEKKWTPEYTKRAKELGYSVTQIITIASIIQKEAADVDQMAGISAVIHNRLKHAVDYPLLQCDSTIKYVELYASKLFDESKIKQYSQYYDTYTTTGLPAGPICNPGLAAIKAALYPEEGSDNLYFCHDKNGKVYYASNDIEHSKNIAITIKVNAE
ncbi:Endolytic murein transglycosylase [bioreactor metagenome]|uniref:Endolytic murein transglycosylase n=1 Tax=bioreactor metagenome TaxID=1076179 RepID=A0A645H5G7_9ZZZZ